MRIKTSIKTLSIATLLATGAFAQTTTETITEAATTAVDTAKDAVVDAATTATETVTETVSDTATTATEVVSETPATTTKSVATEEPTDTTASEGTTDAPATATDGTTAVEKPADAPKKPREIVRETHGSWEIRCDGDEKNCFLYQLAKDKDGNPVAEFSIIPINQGKVVAGITVITPLGTLLTAKFKVTVDNNRPMAFDYQYCVSGGCIARFGLSQAQINIFKGGNNANVAIASVASKGPINLTLSLDGFTAAFKALQANPGK